MARKSLAEMPEYWDGLAVPSQLLLYRAFHMQGIGVFAYLKQQAWKSI